MKKILLGLMATFLVSACVHKMDIQQGNIITQDMVNRLHTGMSEAQVKNLIGSPILINTFSNSRLNYVYTFKPGRGEMTEKQITLVFRNGFLREIEKSKEQLVK